jgi:predicted HicB family RNase H-like nuclease
LQFRVNDDILLLLLLIALRRNKMDKIKLIVYVDKQIHIDTKVQAAKTRQSMSALVEIAIKEYLKRNPVE